MRQAIKLTRTQWHNKVNHKVSIYNYVLSEEALKASPGQYTLVTEDALLIGWSNEADDGNQYVVGIVLLKDKQVITVQVNSIQFV